MDVMHNMASADPIELFGQWLAEAGPSDPNDATAAALPRRIGSPVPEIRRVASGRDTAPVLLVRLLRVPRTDRVLDKRRQPPTRPLLVYPRCRSMENNPAVPLG